MSSEVADSVLVGNYQIGVVYCNVDDGHGDFDCKKLEIRISDLLSGTALLEVLMHEIIHAIYWAYSIDDKDKEERVVSLIGTGVAQVLRDNPNLVDLIDSLTQEHAECFSQLTR